MDSKPVFWGVTKMLKHSVDNTVGLLRKELEIKKGELQESWHLSSLEKIFIENRIYHDIEECETWESVITTIDIGLEPFKKMLLREVTEEDIVKLTEIKIKRITRFDVKKADEYIKGVEEEIKEVQNHLDHIIDFSINYYKQIRKKHGDGRDRKTEIRNLDSIEATQVVVANEKLYVNREEGFIGTGLRKDEYVSECSDIDEVIVFLRDGKYIITKVADKVFVGKDIIHVAVFKRNDERTIYNIIYRDGLNGSIMVKRCAIKGITRDKEYDITKGTKGSKILYMTVNPNGEAEVVKVYLRPRPRLKKPIFEFNFSELAIKGRQSMGNVLTKYAVHKIVLKDEGVSTLGGRKIWFEFEVLRLNDDGRGEYLGEFHGDDKILVITKSGAYRLCSYDLMNHFEDDVMRVEKFRPEKIFSAVYYDADLEFYYIKRFTIDPTDRLTSFIGDNEESRLIKLTEVDYPRLEVAFGGRHKSRENEIIEVAEFIGVKSYKARGKRLSNYEVKIVTELEPLIVKQEEPDDNETMSDDHDEDTSQMSLFDNGN
jgi:topoisomerase-4 subunit A